VLLTQRLVGYYLYSEEMRETIIERAETHLRVGH
jgi:hypothetical protein